jgi:hypothetical protein
MHEYLKNNVKIHSELLLTEILLAFDLTQFVHAKISIGIYRGVKFKISRIALIGLVTRLG